MATAPPIGDPLELVMFYGEEQVHVFTVTDVDGNVVDLSTMSLRFTVETTAATPIKQFDAEAITVSGASNEVANVTIGDTQSDITPAVYQWRLWDDNGPTVYMHGTLAILSTSE